MSVLTDVLQLIMPILTISDNVNLTGTKPKGKIIYV